MRDYTKDLIKNENKEVEPAVLNPSVKDIMMKKDKVVKVANCVSLNVRAEAKIDSNRVRTIKAGTILHVLNEINDYYKVKMEDGTTGYVPIKFTE